MGLVRIQRDPSTVPVTLGSVVMEPIVQTSMNVTQISTTVTPMRPVTTLKGPIPVPVTLGSVEMG